MTKIGEVTICIVCPFCGKEHRVTVPEEGWDKYRFGALAQIAFPNLSATEREQIISGMCPDCQESVFGLAEEEDFYS